MRRYYRNCKRCFRHYSECGEMSKRGYCTDCSKELIWEANIALIEHKGEKFDNWRKGMAASVGAKID